MQLEPKLDLSRVAQDLQIRKVQVESVLRLIEAGNTIPFIARYRRAETGDLDEDTIRRIDAKVAAARRLLERKKTILKSIESQGRLTDDLRQAIALADSPQRLDDLYLPFKPKQKSPAAQARNKGLEPVATAVWQRDPVAGDLDSLLPTLVDPERGLESPEEVLDGVRLLLAEKISEIADVRAVVRMTIWRTGKLRCKKAANARPERAKHYREYFDFTDPIQRIPAHRVMAINRGLREGVLEMAIEWDNDQARQKALSTLAKHLSDEAAGLKAAVSAATDAEAARSESSDSTTADSNEAAATPAADKPGTESEPSESLPGQSSSIEQPKTTPELPPAEPVETGEPLAPEVEYRTPHAALLQAALELALVEFIYPALEKDVIRQLRDEAEEHTLESYARSLKNLLLQRPTPGLRLLAIDPAIKHECYVAAIDEDGNVLEHAAIHPHYVARRKKRQKSKSKQKEKGESPGTTSPADGEQAAPATGDTNDADPVAAPAVDGAATAPQGSAEHRNEPETGSEEAKAVDAPDAPIRENADDSLVQSKTTTGSVPAGAESDLDPEDEQRLKREEARRVVEEIVRKHGIKAVVIGDGEGCRETEAFIAKLIEESLPDLQFAIVSEAGASVYSVSSIGKEELPDVQPGVRGAVSIGRRVHDPLAELVKIDPPHLGASQHYLDVNPRQLRMRLEAVVESCVNFVGADVNRAESHLLRWVAGLNQLIARDLISYRQQHERFRSREQLKQVPVIDENRFVQAAGFLRVEGDNPLDRSWVHPEDYELAHRILGQAGLDAGSLTDLDREEERRSKLAAVDVAAVSKEWDVPELTLRGVIDALTQFGHDARETLPGPVFRNRLLRLEDLQPGQELQGVISNVVDFGAFVDIGLEESGLVHISELANRFIKNPYDVVTVGDVVTVWVLKVDTDNRRVSLTMIPPGTPRRPQRPVRSAESREGGEGRKGRPRSEGRRPPRREDVSRSRRQPQQRSEPRPPQRSRPSRPKRQPPPPKLSKEALEGREELRSFAELGAFFAEKLGIGKPPKKRKKPRASRDKADAAPVDDQPASSDREGRGEPQDKPASIGEADRTVPPGAPETAGTSDDQSPSLEAPAPAPQDAAADGESSDPSITLGDSPAPQNSANEPQDREVGKPSASDQQADTHSQGDNDQAEGEGREAEPEATPKANS